MYTIKKLNKISSKGLELLTHDNYEIASSVDNPDAILVRSADMLNMNLEDSIKAIARAGAGVNNIPLSECSNKGIVVFNTPGANANAVKELVITSLFLASRKLIKGVSWVNTLKGKHDEVASLVESNKSKFQGPEIQGKTLGVIGLGAIGSMVANSALSLGMEVIGYDPFISVDSAWGLSRNVIKSSSIEQLLSISDYISLHIPLNDNTKGCIDKSKFSIMKKGIKIVNLARGGLVVNSDLLDAINQGIVSCYITDFPEDELLCNDAIIPIPHLGASTPESEDNCAIMAVKQLKNYLERGNIKNSVNFPECELEPTGDTRILAIHENIPNMVGQIATVLAESQINITDMLNRHKSNTAYTIIDIEGTLSDITLEKVKTIKGMKKLRIIDKCV